MVRKEEVLKLTVKVKTLSRELREARAHIRYLEKERGIDDLTGASTRRVFDLAFDSSLRSVRGEIEDHRDRGSYLKDVSLILMDLDFFKKVNDTHGHPVGDEVLRKAAALLMGSVRPVDMVARMGGEEFAILLRGANAAVAAQHAEHLRSKIAGLSFKTARKLRVTASFGIASTKHSTDAAELYKLADDALYRAKHEGRNTVVVAA